VLIRELLLQRTATQGGGVRHVETMTVRNNLGVALLEQGKNAEAADVLRDAGRPKWWENKNRNLEKKDSIYSMTTYPGQYRHDAQWWHAGHNKGCVELQNEFLDDKFLWDAKPKWDWTDSAGRIAEDYCKIFRRK